jgi:6-phosphogluconolactonase (cycloisomerase 2 family)
MKKIILSGILATLLFSCKKDQKEDNNKDILYIQTNDFRENQNAVLAYHYVKGGKLQQFGGPFYTNGSGVGNPEQILGPLDSDYELRVSADGKFLLTVNSGSNTIAVFSIKSNGSLEHVAGSPFPSGGQTPVSIDVSGNYVFVVNKSQDPLHETTQAPNYSTFTIDGNGKLTPVPGAKFSTTPGTSPTQNLVSKNKKFLFGDDFLGFMLKSPVGTLRSFNISNSGVLTPVAGTPYFVTGNATGMNGAFGLWEHPVANVLYVGYPLLAQVAAYTINESTGALTLQSTAPAGKAACWIRTNKSGSRMYVLNSGENTVTVYNSTNASSPSLLQKFLLKESGPLYTVPGLGELTTSEPFSLAFSTDEKILYIVNQHTNKDFSIGNYNYLHYLDVSDNGLLSETSIPIQIPVPNTVRPKGSVVISR